MKRVRILLADDHELIQVGLRTVIEAQSGWEVCGVATTGLEAVQAARQHKPDVIVLDFGMPALNGLEALRQIRQASPASEVLVLTMHESERLAREFLTAGAKGYLLKSDAGDLLVQAITHLSQHKPFFTAKVSELVLNGFLNSTKGGEPAQELTARECQIVRLIAEGKTSKEVASLLKVSVHTVETHRTNVMRRLDLHTVGALVRYAIINHIAEV